MNETMQAHIVEMSTDAAYWSTKERRLSKERRAEIMANRLTRGWAFLGVQTAEQHEQEVSEIKQLALQHLN
jgi:ATP-dependent Clp protease adapter protein ClpS